ncbi:hypothetical protein H8788_14540 [Parabacteroides faecis]|uniref:hypothetical protein n=1 Tax=Parabacteroides TaxID=375288 RepID=UPI000EFFA631|nr:MULTISPECIES: hypothetical protein [Parabacteroides]MBC8618961.1 hypothetical protein [Parabacteroides faecis]RHS00083.1 hypothetical protein DWW23_05425 [Parabacteroides sp. AF14-59]
MDKNTEKRYYLNRDRQKLIESLQASDYKIIKATEYAALGLECEYDLNTLHQERQSIRDQINQLELEIAELE